jgi:hypothetical protein
VGVGVKVTAGEEVADGGATVVEAGFVKTTGALIVEVNTGSVDGRFVGLLVFAWQAASARTRVIMIM